MTAETEITIPNTKYPLFITVDASLVGSSQITNLYYTVLQKKGNLSPSFYRAQMQLTNFSKLKIIHTPGKNLTVADMLSRTFTKEQLQTHQLRHKQLPPQMDFSIMKDNQLRPVHYLVKHEEIKYNRTNDCHPILADYGEDQFSSV